MRTTGLCLCIFMVSACAAPASMGGKAPRDAARDLLAAQFARSPEPMVARNAMSECYLARMSNTQVALFLDAATPDDRQSILDAAADAQTIEACVATTGTATS